MSDRGAHRVTGAKAFRSAPIAAFLLVAAVGQSALLSQVPERSDPSRDADPAKARPADARTDAPTSAVTLFRTHCLDCHDADGRGGIGRGLFRSIPDFTDPRWQSSQTDDHLGRAILEGKGKAMPPMKDKLSRAEIQVLVGLIRSFPDGRPPIPVDDDEQQRPERPAPAAAPAIRVDPARSGDVRAGASSAAAPLFQRSCRVCHGADGKGDGQRASMPEIPDFTATAWHERRTRAELTASILVGRGPHMPAFGDALSVEQARMLEEFIRALGPKRPDSAEPPATDFDARFSDLRRELDSLKRQYRAVSPRLPRKAHDGLRGGAGNWPIRAPGSLLPRARTLCMNSEKPR